MRCHHEASLFTFNSYITLTYDDAHVPRDGSLNVKHFQEFLYRLRSSLSYDPVRVSQGKPALFNSDTGRVRYFHCGEYGERTGRPHYHALLFGLDFKDKYQNGERRGFPIYLSRTLTDLWGMGSLERQEIGAVTFESAAYVARYITKKISGPDADAYYEGRKPEYTTGSSRPAIGKDWFEKFRSDVFPHDEVVIRGVRQKPPRYYLDELAKADPEEAQRIKSERKNNIDSNTIKHSTPERLAVREIVHEEKATRLKRNL